MSAFTENSSNVKISMIALAVNFLATVSYGQEPAF